MKITARLRASAKEDNRRTFPSSLLLEAADEIEALGKFYYDASVRADERRVMCDEKDETIKRLTRRLHFLRGVIWDNLIHVGGDGCTASGYSADDIPDELLYDAVVDASLPSVRETQTFFGSGKS